MKRLFSLVLCLMLIYGQAESATGWLKTKPAGSGAYGSPSDIDTFQGENNAALDLVLSNYRRGCDIQYLSASTLTVAAGEVVVSNSAGTIRLMLANAASTTVSWSDIDTGAEAGSTTYYIYSIGSATTDTAFTVKISTSATGPSGVTYYKKLGSFYNDASSNITLIQNNDTPELGDWVAKTYTTTYQALTDGYVVAYGDGTASTISHMEGYTDSASTPTTQRAYFYTPNGLSPNCGGSISFPVRKGDYWKITVTDMTPTVYWLPINKN